MQSLTRRALRVPSSVRCASSQAGATSTAAATAPTTPAPAPAASASASTSQTPNTLNTAKIQIGPTHLNRLSEHYTRTLQTSLLYMTYSPRLHEQAELLAQATSPAVPHIPSAQRGWDMTSPYAALRPARPNRGNRRPNPALRQLDVHDPAKDIVRLERVVITAFCKDAIANKNHLVPLIAQLRAISGARVVGSAADTSVNHEHQGHMGHVKILRSKSGAASFKLRVGMPIGAQATLSGPPALQLIDQLVTFVLPRLRTFAGFPLPPAGQPDGSAAAQSGVVSLGMTPEAMSLWPATEINWDSYPGKAVGFQIDCITNTRGPGATKRARLLLSGLGVPFVRRGDMSL